MVEILYWLFIGACVGGFGTFAGRCLRPMICARFKIDIRSLAEELEDNFGLIVCTSGWTLWCASISVAAFYLGSPSTVNVAMLAVIGPLSAFVPNSQWLV